MKNTLQGVVNHKFANILEHLFNIDITHNINFNLYKNYIKKIDGLDNILTTQKYFLKNMGIMERAEMISKNQNFLKKADLYYRIKRLTDEKYMGSLFKVLFVSKSKNNFNLGFK